MNYSEKSDIISKERIRLYLSEDTKDIPIEIHSVLDSTNAYAKKKASEGGKEWTLILALSQTAGKGRGEHTFHSPSGSGIYMSLILRPLLPANKVLLLTTATSVAVAESIEEVTGKKTGIKWVNDIYINRKKVCGILAEASFLPDCSGMEYAVIGIGINAYPPENGFPDDIKTIAGAISDKPLKDMKTRLIAGIVNRLMSFYPVIESKPFFDGYKKRLMFKNEKVRVIRSDGEKPATIVDIDEDFHLLVTYHDGTNELLSSGEISVKQ